VEILRLVGPLRLCDGGALVIFHRKEGIPMPTFISLYKLTDQGIKNIKEAPGRVEDAIKGAEAMGSQGDRLLFSHGGIRLCGHW
jgi:hypothetical protein